MMKFLKTIFWFLKRPKYIPHLKRVLQKETNNTMQLAKEEALIWCQEREKTPTEVLNTILGKQEDSYPPISILFPDMMKTAKEVEQKCPFTMGGEGSTTVLYHLVKSLRPVRTLETGVAYGWSSLAILLGMNGHDNAHLISNDMPYLKMGNDEYVGCVVPENLRSSWTLQRQADIKGIPMAIKAFKGTLDLCHYDSDKSYTGRMWSSPILWDALAKGGLFISDDINDNMAFRDFCTEIGKEPLIFEHKEKYVGILQK